MPHAHRHHNAFVIPFFLILFFALAEFAGGLWTQSLALMGDAWHMLFDVLALGVAMIASYYAQKYGQNTRVELYGAAINAVSMLVVIAWIVYEAIERFKSPLAVRGLYVMSIALIGLIVNIFVAKHLHQSTHHDHDHASLNHRAALLHVLGDLLGSVVALISGAVIYFTNWVRVDPVLSLLIALLLFALTAKTLGHLKKAW